MSHMYDLIDAAIYMLPIVITLGMAGFFSVRHLRHA